MASEANREVEAAIQAAEDGVGCVAGVGHVLEGPEDQGGLDCEIEPGSPQGQVFPCGPSRHGAFGSFVGQGGAGAPGHVGDPVVPEERMGFAAIGAANVAWEARASGPGGDAAPEAVGPGERPIVFTITVPFESHLEAEMARLAMDIEAPSQHQDVQNEFRVYGSILAVRWIAEDPSSLQESVNTFFQLLSLLL
ncbi:EKC/KEOPS complex subunit LAGE3-like [Rousettus aegyptiacus]|uniref:EKC/KEOPS complex subunit LAGE3-like n=1 Tax=Rousettus aegyptiacus TaxID=9407 RepID=UPI00168CEF21|nr:EKC/KEOPS complex subunit LAGE3-like [Rousettus aegyptiacus]